MQSVEYSYSSKKTGANGCDDSHYDYLWEQEGCNLDKANGFTFTAQTTMADGKTYAVGDYAYFYTNTYPFTHGGAATPARDSWCVLDVSNL